MARLGTGRKMRRAQDDVGGRSGCEGLAWAGRGDAEGSRDTEEARTGELTRGILNWSSGCPGFWMLRFDRQRAEMHT